MSGSIYQDEWRAIARLVVSLQREFRVTLFPHEEGVIDGVVLSLLARLYLAQSEGTAMTISMLSRAIGVSSATCRRKLAALIDQGFITREGETYRFVAWMGEDDQRRMLNRLAAILNQATTEMALAKLATSVAH
jgi:DNA-binding MarR family transcriptional regulator